MIWGYDIDNPSHPFFHFPEWVEHEGLPSWDDECANRSPDLVAYARSEAPLESIARSDTFQLGLVFAELFTGRNPAVAPPGGDLLAPFQLEPLWSIPGALGSAISNIIARMLHSDAARRATVDELLPAWQGVFEDAADRLNALEGRVF